MKSFSRRGSSRKRTVLIAEALEDRTVPAGNVSAFVSGGVLHIWGDAQANRVWVSGAGEDAAVVASLDGTTINGVHVAQRFEGIQFAYDIQLHDGNDFLYVTGLTGDAGLFVQMGDGNDGVAIDNCDIEGATVIHTGTGNDKVSVGMGSQNFSTYDFGVGDDRIEVAGTEFGDVVFAGGGGTDSMGLLAVRWTRVPMTTGFESVFSSLMPVANNDRVATDPGDPITVNVLANDTSAIGILDPATVRLTSQPGHGTARVNANGTITYTPSSTTTATFDTFKYAVRNSTGAVSNEATVVVQLDDGSDTVGPTPAITTTATNPSGLAVIPFTIAFDENVTGFDQTGVTVTNGTLSAFTAVNGSTFTFNVTPTADGTVGVSVAAAAAQDIAGNDSSAASTTIQSDRTSPSTTITSTFPDPSNVAPIPITVTFSEPVTGFIAADVVVTNGTVSGFTGSGASYTFNIAPTAEGPVTVDVAAGTATDAAGNPNSAATQFSIVFDQSGPTVALTSPATSPTNLSPIPVTATFSQDVTAFDATDITVTNGAVSNFAGSGTTYTFDVTPTADGAVTVNVGADVATDTAGNGNTAAPPLSVTSDTTAPTAVVSSTSSDPTSTNPIPFTVTFSETVTGFTSGDVLVNNGAVTNFSGSGTTYTFDVVPSGAAVTVSVSVPAGVCEDAATNGNLVSNTLTRDFAGSTVSATFSTVASDPTNLATIPMTVIFGEDVTGFDATDLSVINGTVANFAGTGDTYTFDLIPTADGPVVIDLAAGAATGVSTNPTSAANFTITSDQTSPTPTISTTATDPTNLAAIPFTVTFDENANGFTDAGVTVTNGTVSNFSGSGTTYTFDVTPTADGDVTVEVNAAVATDDAGNDNVAATPVTIVSDQTDPTVTNDLAPTDAVTGTGFDVSGVTGVEVSIFDGTNYWSGAAFDSATEVFQTATSGDNFATWSFALSANGTFTVHSVATDAAGNTGEATDAVVVS